MLIIVRMFFRFQLELYVNQVVRIQPEEKRSKLKKPDAL